MVGVMDDEREEGGARMRRGIVIGVTLLGIAAAVLIAVGAYHAGAHHTVVQQTTQSGEIVRVGPGYYGHWGWGFFPGFLLFPLILFGFFFLMRGLFWGRRWGGPGGPGGYGRGYGWEEKGRMFEDWHKRQHEQSSGDHPPAGGEPSSA
jgi:hypothetical protein